MKAITNQKATLDFLLATGFCLLASVSCLSLVTRDCFSYTRPDEFDDALERRARLEDRGDAERLHRGYVHVRDDSSQHDQHILHPALVEQRPQLRNNGRVRSGEDRKPDHIGVFLERRRYDLLGGLSQAGIDDLHAGIPQGARDDLRAPVMAVQSRLGHDHSNAPLVFRAHKPP